MSNNYLIQDRQSGRTTRMVMEAIRLTRADRRAVYILMKDYHEVRRVQAGFPDLKDFPSIQIEPLDAFPNLVWNNMLPGPNAHPNCIVLVDHFAIEVMLRNQLRELHRFDKEEL